MSKLQLPDVSLCIIDCMDVNRAIKVLEHCKTKVDFGAVKLFSHIPTEYPDRVRIKPLNTLIAYSIFMLTKFYSYIDTSHIIIVQRDGWILNPESFNPDWMQLDFIGPLFMQNDKVGSGGCSLRSRKIMEEVSKTLPEWNWSQKQADEIQLTIPFYEDGMISLTEFADNFKIASLDEAANWGQAGNRNPQYFRQRPFSFHRTWQDIDFETGIVDSSDTTADIQNTYDHEIDKL